MAHRHVVPPADRGRALSRRVAVGRLGAAGIGATAVLALVRPTARAAQEQPPDNTTTTVLLFFDDVLNTLSATGMVDQATVDTLLDPNFRDEHNAFVYPHPDDGFPNLDGFLALAKAFPDMRFAVDTVLADQDLVMAFSTFTGTHDGEFFGVPPSGKAVDIDGIDLFRFRGDRIAQHWSFADVFKLLDQIRAP